MRIRGSGYCSTLEAAGERDEKLQEAVAVVTLQEAVAVLSKRMQRCAGNSATKEQEHKLSK